MDNEDDTQLSSCWRCPFLGSDYFCLIYRKFVISSTQSTASMHTESDRMTFATRAHCITFVHFCWFTCSSAYGCDQHWTDWGPLARSRSTCRWVVRNCYCAECKALSRWAVNTLIAPILGYCWATSKRFICRCTVASLYNCHRTVQSYVRDR